MFFASSYAKEEMGNERFHQVCFCGSSGYYMVCTNSAYVVNNINSDAEIEKIAIAQNDQGIDTEDRIQKLLLVLEK